MKDEIRLRDVLSVVLSCLGIFAILVFLADAAYAESAIEIAEDESIRGGIDAVWAGLGALLAGAIGVFLKRPQDVLRERREGTNGTGSQSIAQVALDAIRAHENTCERYREEQREETRRIHGRIDEVHQKMAEIAADVAYLRGKAEGA